MALCLRKPHTSEVDLRAGKFSCLKLFEREGSEPYPFPTQVELLPVCQLYVQVNDGHLRRGDGLGQLGSYSILSPESAPG